MSTTILNLYCSVDYENRNMQEDSFQTEAEITHDGIVHWMVPAMFSSSCVIEVARYPFDSQVCKLKFVSWAHRMHEIDLILMSNNMEVSKTYIVNHPNSTFQILSKIRRLSHIIAFIW